MASLYLIKRGPQPLYHRAPFHPVIVCDRKRLCAIEQGASSAYATVWEKHSSTADGAGWLLKRWQGLELDYGHVVHAVTLPDGSQGGFWRDYDDRFTVKGLLSGAIWWSSNRMPEWLAKKGLRYPPDQFSQITILDGLADDGVSGVPHLRQWPDFWPKNETATTKGSIL